MESAFAASCHRVWDSLSQNNSKLLSRQLWIGNFCCRPSPAKAADFVNFEMGGFSIVVSTIAATVPSAVVVVVVVVVFVVSTVLTFEVSLLAPECPPDYFPEQRRWISPRTPIKDTGN